MRAVLLFLLIQAGAVPQAGISGSIIDAGVPNRQPLFFARVELTPDSGSLNVLRTDVDGRFSFPNLRPGRYRLSVSRDGFLRKSVNVTVAAGQPRNDVVIALDGAPTVFGRIKDQNNIPVSDVLVDAIKVVYGPRGDRSVLSVESALSDDRGEYHLYWLDPGDYYIRASSLPQKAGMTLPGNPPRDASPSYAPTYYPGLRDPKDATLIHLRIDSNLTGFDIKLQPTTLLGLGGHIAIEASALPVITTITVAPAGDSASYQQYQGRSSGDGTYLVNGMPPGTYIVSAQYSVGTQQLTVHRKFALKGLERSFSLQLSPGSSVSGNIVTESGRALDLRSARVALESVDPDLPSPRIASIDANRQFTADRVEAGDYAIRILNLPGDAYLKSAKSGDADILSMPLHLNWASPEPIRVVLGTDGSRLEGVVMDSINRPAADAQVVLVPDAARRNAPDQFVIATSDDDGHFVLHGIPPGEYKLFAWQSVEPNAWLSPIYLLGYENLGMALTVPPSSAGSTQVRLIPMD